ncbi:MAG: hypothetical protein GX872_08750 [Firmicutes bacterium]|nr:hypothetical protein [Bacillota bacterium]HXL05043.1 hypothetical protein [Bacillota bacterium]
MSSGSDEGKETVDRLLYALERVFAIVLGLFLVLTVLGQIILSTPEGRAGFSRVERLEGVRLNVDAYSEDNSN